MVGAGEAQVEHGMSIGFLPPATRKLESLLDDMAVSAFDFPRTDGQSSAPGSGIVIKIDQVGTLFSKIFFELVHDPAGSIPDAMNGCLWTKASGLCRLLPEPRSRFGIAQGRSVNRLHFSLSPRTAQAHFPPIQLFARAPVWPASGFHDGDHAAVHLRDQPWNGAFTTGIASIARPCLNVCRRTAVGATLIS